MKGKKHLFNLHCAAVTNKQSLLTSILKQDGVTDCLRNTHKTENGLIPVNVPCNVSPDPAQVDIASHCFANCGEFGVGEPSYTLSQTSTAPAASRMIIM